MSLLFGTALTSSINIDTENFYSDDNQFQIKTNSTERLRIDNTGKIGMMEDDPQEALHISRTSGAVKVRLENDVGYSNFGMASDGDFVINNTIADKDIELTIDNTTWLNISGSEGSLTIADAGGNPATPTNKLWNNGGTLYWNGTDLTAGGGGSSVWSLNGTEAYYNSGNVGIGTNNPNYNLDVVGTINTSEKLYINAGDTELLNNSGNFQIRHKTGTWYNQVDTTISQNRKYELKLWGSDGELSRFIMARDSIEYLFSETTALDLTSSRLYINGNVGIGTDNPSEKIEVNGGNTYSYIKFVNDNNSDGFQFGMDSGGSPTINSKNANADIKFYTNNSKVMTLDDDGDLLIGSGSSASYKLELEVDSAGKPSSSTWDIISDRKYKKDITDANDNDACNILKQVRLKKFKYNNKLNLDKKLNIDENEEHIGVVADEIKTILPECVKTTKIKDDNKNVVDTYDSVNLHKLFVMNISATKDLINRIESLEEDILNLKNKKT